MKRSGTYTEPVRPFKRMRRFVRRKSQWFLRLSRKKKILLISAPIVAFLVITPVATYAYYARDISDQERLMNRNNTGIVLTDKDGAPIYSVGRAQRREVLPLEDIAKVTQQALIASEDKNFYEHGGFSPFSILRALYTNVASKNLTGYGGSTLTQQLAKNTLLTSNQTILRKYQELVVSVAIEQQYSKDQILDMYLNSVYYGDNAFGIEDAAKIYFDTTPDKLNLAQSAMLIGVLPAPSAYSPVTGDPELAKERQKTVLERMENSGYITNEQVEAAAAENLVYAPAQNINTDNAPFFAQMTLDKLYETYGEEKVIRSGYQVRTTLDLGVQKQLESNIQDHISYIQQNGGSNASAVVIDPRSGAVTALVGSADYNNPDWGKVNMVTTARQPGSSFKTIYYSRALANGVITPATILSDTAKDFNGYAPLNADKLFRGDVTVRSAISQSLNIPSVEVMQKLGVTTAVSGAREMGISSIDSKQDYGLALALGTAEVPLLEMTNAYASLANSGSQYTPNFITSINDKFDKTIYTNQPNATPVISPEGAYLMSSILSDNNARSPIFGSSLTVPGVSAAVKTGTTDENRDAWTIGYTPQAVVGVWVGNNNNDAMLNGGSGMAGPIWKSTMAEIAAAERPNAFVKPPGIVTKSICYSNGGLANQTGAGTYQEVFLSSRLPSERCTVKSTVSDPVEPPKELKPETPVVEQPDPAPEVPVIPEPDPTPPGDGDDGGIVTPPVAPVIPPVVPPVAPTP